jgi:hypothetical protein
MLKIIKFEMWRFYWHSIKPLVDICQPAEVIFFMFLFKLMLYCQIWAQTYLFMLMHLNSFAYTA